MKKSVVQANFQLMDNYISEFSLNVFKKINIEEKDLIGQIELKYNIDITENEEKVSEIIIVMNALFKGIGDIDKGNFEQMLKINGATTLSHLCRAYINSATSLSGMPPITMPLINFYEFFKNAKEESEILEKRGESK